MGRTRYPRKHRSQHSVDTIMQRMLPPYRREAPVQLDPIWREARELGVESEYGSMLDPAWDSRSMPEPRSGTWALTPDHYFRDHSARELQKDWEGDDGHLEFSPEPSQRDIGNCLMDTPDCNCLWLLFDAFQNPPESGRLSYDPKEGDLAMLPSTNRPPGYVCAGRDPSKHVRIRSVSLEGFVTPFTRDSHEGSSRTFFEPEGGSPQAPGPVVETDRSRTMSQDEDGPSEFDEVPEVNWNLEAEPREANQPVDKVENIGQAIDYDQPDIDTQLRRPSQNPAPDIDLRETLTKVGKEYNCANIAWAKEQNDPSEALRNLPEPYCGPLQTPNPQAPPQYEDDPMQDVTAPELLDSDEEVGSAVAWAPQSGDVIILKSCRYEIPWPGFDGKVEIYTDDNENSNPTGPWTCWFEEGDVIIRFGSYSSKWQWHQAPQIRVYQFREGEFFLVARQSMQPMYPLEYKFVDPKEKIPHHMDFRFKPRWGDLIINRGIQYPFVWYVYWWAEGMPVRPSDLLIRAAYDQDENFSYCDAELYLRNPNPDFPDNWIFLGKDDYCFPNTY